MSRVFTVVGGTGFLGSRVVRHLVGRGHRVRIAARHPHRPDDLPNPDLAELVRADLFEPATLSAALTGADGAVNATSLYLEKGDLTFEAVHVKGAARLARLAREARVPHLIHVSGIGSDPAARDPYIRARGEGEAAVRDACPDVTLVRPSAMFGPDDALLGAILDTARRLPVYPLFGRGESRLQPVHVDDVAQAIATALHTADAAPCYEFAGPNVYTYRQLVAAVAGAAGLRVRPVSVPFPVWHAAASVAERLPGAPLTRSQVALIRDGNVADEAMPGLRDLGVEPQDIADFVRDQRGRAEQAEQIGA